MYRVLSPMYRQEKQSIKSIRDFAITAICNAKDGSPLALLSERESHQSNHNLKCNDWYKKVKENKHKATRLTKSMIDEAIAMLFAGHDTVSSTLSWTLHLLSLYPQKQK